MDDARFLNQRIKDAILSALGQDEIRTRNNLGLLKLPVDATIALFETTGVPRDIKVKKIVAVILKIDAFAGCVGGDQDPQGVLLGVGIKSGFEGFALVIAETAVKDRDSF